MSPEYDTATKIWTVVLGVMLMLLIEWPALFTAHVQHPPHKGHLGWHLFASAIGVVAPLSWLVDKVRRQRVGVPWAAAVGVILLWGVIGVAWTRSS